MTTDIERLRELASNHVDRNRIGTHWEGCEEAHRDCYILALLDRLEAAERSASIQRQRADGADDQLVWLSQWCECTFGVDTNQVIGHDGWPNKLVEVVASAAEQRADAAYEQCAQVCEEIASTARSPLGHAKARSLQDAAAAIRSLAHRAQEVGE